jgi:hypothetical protein
MVSLRIILPISTHPITFKDVNMIIDFDKSEFFKIKNHGRTPRK